jgi:hypothetical protein
MNARERDFEFLSSLQWEVREIEGAHKIGWITDERAAYLTAQITKRMKDVQSRLGLGISPAHTYPATYSRSYSEIEWYVIGHSHICGTGKRTGLTFEEEWPVYVLHSFLHPEYNGVQVALTIDGFVKQESAQVWQVNQQTSSQEEEDDQG